MLAIAAAGLLLPDPRAVLAGDEALAFYDGREYLRVTNFNRSLRAPTRTEIMSGDSSAEPMLSPESPDLLRAAVARYQKIVDNGGWPILSANGRIVPGGRTPANAVLRRRLAIEGYLPVDPEGDDPYGGDIYDEAVREAVRLFQQRHGLIVNGRINPDTFRALAVPAGERLKTLRANLARTERYAKGLGGSYIVVNIPAAQLDAVEGNALYSRHNVVVGKVDRPSPALMSKISQLNFNPYWNAPKSIVERDIIPAVRKDPALLKKMGIKIYDGYGGKEIDPETIDWKTLDPGRYLFRQDPGEDNAMASVKITFHNEYAVYMHDTPTKQLFTESQRYFSSGCVRVDQINILVEWLLRDEKNWSMERIEEVNHSGKRLDVSLKKRPQLRFAYLTAWAATDGGVHFRDDIYFLDGTGFIAGQPLTLTDL